MKNETSVDKIPVKTKIAYAMGDVGTNMVYQTVTFYYLFFLTDVALLAASLAGLILLIVRFIDAFTDPLVGYISDCTRTPWGRRRPYVLFGSIGCGLTFALLFTYFPIADQNLLFTRSLINYFFFTAVFMTMMYIPYSALTPDMTQDYNERTNLTGYRRAGAIIGVFIAAGLAMPLVSMFQDKRTGFGVVAAIFGTIFIVFGLIVFFSVKERVVTSSQPKPSAVLRSYVDSLKNRPFLILALGYVIVDMAIALTSSSMIYYMKYYMKQESLVSTLFLTLLGTALVCIPIWTYLSRRIDKKWAYFAGTGFFAGAMLCIFCLKPDQLVLMYFLTALAGVGLSTHFVIPWAMLPDTIEHNELETGTRNEGIFYGMISFAPKLGGALAGFILGQVLSMTNYLPNLADQNGETLLGIRLTFCIIPAILIIFGMIVILKYPIDLAKYREILRLLGGNNK